MQPIGWLFLCVAWVSIISALAYCLTRVLRAQPEEGKPHKGRRKND
jgi:hypothetical protein